MDPKLFAPKVPWGLKPMPSFIFGLRLWPVITWTGDLWSHPATWIVTVWVIQVLLDWDSATLLIPRGPIEGAESSTNLNILTQVRCSWKNLPMPTLNTSFYIYNVQSTIYKKNQQINICFVFLRRVLRMIYRCYSSMVQWHSMIAL